MKLYSLSPQASIKMADDPKLVNILKESLLRYQIDIAIETGTFDGTGSTRIISECFLQTKSPKSYITFEIGFQSWILSLKNLQKYPFVRPLWGCSISREKAMEFVKQDEMILNHEQYSDIYIDDLQNPVEFYAKELEGMLNKSGAVFSPPTKIERILNKLKIIREIKSENNMESQAREFFWSGENLLPLYLNLHKEDRPLIILDSAGGCGWFEFQTALQTMQGKSFLLLLDDTHHIKHFRSLQYIKNQKSFNLIAESSVHGWALAWHE